MTVEHARQWGLCPPACGLPPRSFGKDEAAHRDTGVMRDARRQT